MGETQQTERLLGGTDRGVLWLELATPNGPRVERRLDPGVCDHEFRNALARMRRRPYPRFIPVADEGWSGIHYRLDYSIEPGALPLAESFGALHWRRRLELVAEVCRILPEWSSAGIRPYGLNPLNLLVCEHAGRLYPYLLPCPPVTFGSPWDLHECHPLVLCCIAPEVIRGLPFDARQVDSYAAGALTALALGQAPEPWLEGEEALEAQACGALLPFDPSLPQVERFFASVPELRALIQLVTRHLSISPDARPAELGELERACDSAVRATEPLTLAGTLASESRLREALEVLEWAISTQAPDLEALVWAAEIAAGLGEEDHSLHHLDRALELEPSSLPLRARRTEAALRLYLKQGPPLPGEDDPEGDRILKDLQRIKLLPVEPGQSHRCQLMAAAVYRRRGDLYSVAACLYEAAALEPADLGVLLDYVKCLRDLGDDAAAQSAAHLGLHRAERMYLSQLLGETECLHWKRSFQALLR